MLFVFIAIILLLLLRVLNIHIEICTLDYCKTLSVSLIALPNYDVFIASSLISYYSIIVTFNCHWL